MAATPVEAITGRRKWLAALLSRDTICTRKELPSGAGGVTVGDDMLAEASEG
ncbi:hypothetical protein NEUTE1DRAFT_96745 [Neurospora tetrasperma FGSC 2508]|uniref:Uncharacterized protein n=1 Tax=Neurospora tetrasperma (strain FGSC 2508 / ATCC MYA-4615 / P0657) TaxID=510951 RepID=F8N328_NEUT8|nr:uncharacterized protein NEUTE1DRAFT_96745 [Neurospora tetrasperma FGSC 2508]EGO52539.1 hypothetical protein NEUTE1DRAFT_96745 [Neurospora tetrasperma FGSC 2508]EGZ77359.1 hypothetical protein NEUTE2DRAFT_119422 [Neurospora tetrasperma FGSC 2509]